MCVCFFGGILEMQSILKTMIIIALSRLTQRESIFLLQSFPSLVPVQQHIVRVKQFLIRVNSFVLNVVC